MINVDDCAQNLNCLLLIALSSRMHHAHKDMQQHPCTAYDRPPDSGQHGERGRRRLTGTWGRLSAGHRAACEAQREPRQAAPWRLSCSAIGVLSGWC